MLNSTTYYLGTYDMYGNIIYPPQTYIDPCKPCSRGTGGYCPSCPHDLANKNFEEFQDFMTNPNGG